MLEGFWKERLVSEIWSSRRPPELGEKQKQGMDIYETKQKDSSTISINKSMVTNHKKKHIEDDSELCVCNTHMCVYYIYIYV
jgi:hypothetical protein